ncbi:hypothetical protein GW17_00029458 [Ensete ventricosum]|nr:hypothetical protein GW17_00029458 [Ensete ventricosum]
MIAPIEEPKLKDMTLEPKEKDIPQSATRTVPTLADYTNLQKLKIEGFLEQQSIIILIDARSTHNFMSTNHEIFQKRKAGDSTREPNDYNHNTTLGGVPKEKSSGFPIQIQGFHEIEDKKPLPHLAENLCISTKLSRLPPLKLCGCGRDSHL